MAYAKNIWISDREMKKGRKTVYVLLFVADTLIFICISFSFCHNKKPYYGAVLICRCLWLSDIDVSCCDHLLKNFSLSKRQDLNQFYKMITSS